MLIGNSVAVVEFCDKSWKYIVLAIKELEENFIPLQATEKARKKCFSDIALRISALEQAYGAV